MSSVQPVRLRGEARLAGGVPAPAEVALLADGFSVAVGGGAPWSATYRDVTTLVVDAGAVLVGLGAAGTGQRWLFERFGAATGALSRGLRDGRLRQALCDGLVELHDGAPVELVEFAAGAATGVAQLLYHDRGVALAPLEGSGAPLRFARGDIGHLAVDAAGGTLRIAGAAGILARGLASLDLLRLGPAASSHRDRWAALRDGAVADIAGILGVLLADAPFEVRSRALGAVREGRPVERSALGPAWGIVEAAVLTEPTFEVSYRTLASRAGDAASRWLAVAADQPGSIDPPRIWFLVALPGNLLALELVSQGAHATYCFRVAPRSSFGGGAIDTELLAAAAGDVSEALVDGRFLREPMAIPGDRLADPEYLRYRLALAVLPSLAAARGRFVARLVHSDEAAWAAALDDLIRWHGAQRDEAAEWPGRAAQEAAIPVKED
jgi:hypothetical protein